MAEEIQNNPTKDAAPATEAPAETEVVTEEVAETVAEEVSTTEAAQVLASGMIVRVHQKIKETTPKGDERERVQIFEGTIIAKKGHDVKSSTITVRKIASGVGVERIFPINLPTLAKIEVVKQLDTRRAKLYYLRTYKKKIRERPAKQKQAA